MNFELGLRDSASSKLSTLSKIFLAILVVAAAMLLQLFAFGSSAQAATANSAKLSINTCDQAIGGMNKTLTLIAKRRVGLRNAKKARGISKSKRAKKVKRAKKLLKSAQKQGNDVRAAIKKLCLGSGVGSLDAQCTLSITKLESLINLKYTRTLQYKKLKKPKSKSKKAQARYKKRKRTMKTKLNNLGKQIQAQTETFAKACGGNNGGGSGGGTGGTGTGVGGSGDGDGGSGADTTAPGEVTITGPTGSTNDNTPTFLVTPPEGEVGGRVECKVDDGEFETVAGVGTVQYTTTELSDGSHTVTCRYVDAAGNVGPGTSADIDVDTQGSTGGPDIDVPGTGPGGETNDPQPEVIVTPPSGENGGRLECKISGSGYAGEFAEFTTVTSPWTLPELPEGTYTITCRYIDGAGNPGEESTYTIVIDRTAPGAPVVSGPAGPTSDTTPQVDITPAEAGGTLECKIDDGEFFEVPGSGPTPELSEGTHSITCRQTDAAGNTGADGSATVTIDTTAPGAVTISGPSGATSDTTPAFNLSGAEDGESYECKVDDGAFVSTGATFVTGELGEGTHTVTCRLVDEAGNVGPETSETVEIDLSAPGSVTITGPTGPTNDTTPTITIDTDETDGHVECKIDDGEYQTVTSPWTLPELSEGTHTVTCRNVDGAGNPGPETTITIVIDTTAPSAITVTGPSGLVNTATPTWTITGGQPDGSYECKVDGGSFAAVGSSFTPAALSQGAHTVTCRAVDAVGNSTAEVSKSVDVDTVAPNLTIDSGAPRWDGTHAFNFSVSESSAIKCGIDGGAQTTVSNPYVTGVLSNGSHTISCTATDAAGNVGAPVVKTFGVFADPVVMSRTGGFQWGIACTGSALLNWALGCPDDSLTVTIPANPNGLTGNYLVDLTGEIKKISSTLGFGSTYSMFITVDGASVASDSETVPFDLFGLFAANLAASKTNLSLSASSSHTIKLSLKTSSLISVLPSAQSSKLSVSIHH